MFGAAVRAEHGDAQVGEPARDGRGHRRSTQARVLHVRQVLGGEVGVIEQAGDVVGGTAADGQIVAEHQRQGLTGIPGVGEIDRSGVHDRDQECVDHADEMPDRGCGELQAAVRRIHRGQLPGFVTERIVTVQNTFGIAGGSGGEGDERDRGGVDLGDAGQRIVVEKVFESAVDDAGDGYVRGDRRIVGEAAERGREDEHLRLDLAEDERDLLESVEVDDGDHGGAQERRRPERGCGLHPVGQLEGDHVAGAHTALCQAGRELPGHALHVGERAAPRPQARVDVELGVGGGRQACVQEVADGLVGPPPVGQVLLGEVCGNRSHRGHLLRAAESVVRGVLMYENANLSGREQPPGGTECLSVGVGGCAGCGRRSRRAWHCGSVPHRW